MVIKSQRRVVNSSSSPCVRNIKSLKQIQKRITIEVGGKIKGKRRDAEEMEVSS